MDVFTPSTASVVSRSTQDFFVAASRGAVFLAIFGAFGFGGAFGARAFFVGFAGSASVTIAISASVG